MKVCKGVILLKRSYSDWFMYALSRLKPIQKAVALVIIKSLRQPLFNGMMNLAFL